MANKKKILVAYASGTGSTEKLAQAIAEGVEKIKDISAEIKRAKDVKPEDAASADGYAFGSHSAFEYTGGELKMLFEDLYRVRNSLSGKPVLLFAVIQGGQVSVLESVDKAVDVFKPRRIKPDIVVQGMPGEADKARAMEMGVKLAEEAKKHEYFIA